MRRATIPRAMVHIGGAATALPIVAIVAIWQRLLRQIGRWPWILAVRPDGWWTMFCDIVRCPDCRVVVFAVAGYAYWRSGDPIARVIGHEGVRVRSIVRRTEL